ncbi:ArsB/NhaD family transporter [Fodinicola feengrottensis]|uniref:ArsB/NhaD family transporter n=1 Tax=Fodinicola feengrottensis TaxID=435914 RepID=A0ABN2G5T2_9ACTN
MLLVATLAVAIAAPRRVPEAAVAVPAAAVAVLAGLLPATAAWTETLRLAPTVGFLVAILLLAHLSDTEGIFRWAGAAMSRIAAGRPQRLLAVVFGVAALTTAVLSLDATVVLLTPVVFSTATLMRARPKPHVYACTHLANSASLLLPVSNLTNLLAYRTSGLSFAAFAVLMALPWLVVIGVEYAVFRRFFDTDLSSPARATQQPVGRPPVFAIVVLGGCLLGFATAGPLGVDPAIVAGAGAVVLLVRRLFVRTEPPVRTVWKAILEANPLFCLFVLALGIVVAAVSRHGLGALLAAVFPSGDSLVALLLAAAVAAVLANLVNNLPAALLLIPVAAGHPGLLLAVLLGVNVGPNLTYVGSLATLLWRRILRAREAGPAMGEFLRLGALTVPTALVAGVCALWLSLQLTGLGG